MTELKLVWALDPPPPLAELELKPPLVEYVRRATEDLMAVRGARAQAESWEGARRRAAGPLMAFYLFLTGLAPHLNRHSCPIAPGGEGGALWAGGCGESLLPQQEGGAAPSYHLYSKAEAEPRLSGAGCHPLPPGALLPWNRMIWAPTATSTTRWLVWSPPTQPWWPLSMELCSVGFVPGPCCKPRPQGLGCAGGVGGSIGKWAAERVPRPAAVPPPSPPPHCPLAGLGGGNR